MRCVNPRVELVDTDPGGRYDGAQHRLAGAREGRRRRDLDPERRAASRRTSLVVAEDGGAATYGDALNVAAADASCTSTWRRPPAAVRVEPFVADLHRRRPRELEHPAHGDRVRGVDDAVVVADRPARRRSPTRCRGAATANRPDDVTVAVELIGDGARDDEVPGVTVDTDPGTDGGPAPPGHGGGGFDDGATPRPSEHLATYTVVLDTAARGAR